MSGVAEWVVNGQVNNVVKRVCVPVDLLFSRSSQSFSSSSVDQSELPSCRLSPSFEWIRLVLSVCVCVLATAVSDFVDFFLFFPCLSSAWPRWKSFYDSWISLRFSGRRRLLLLLLLLLLISTCTYFVLIMLSWLADSQVSPEQIQMGGKAKKELFVYKCGQPRECNQEPTNRSTTAPAAVHSLKGKSQLFLPSSNRAFSVFDVCVHLCKNEWKKWKQLAVAVYMSVCEAAFAERTAVEERKESWETDVKGFRTTTTNGMQLNSILDHRIMSTLYVHKYSRHMWVAWPGPVMLFGALTERDRSRIPP